MSATSGTKVVFEWGSIKITSYIDRNPGIFYLEIFSSLTAKMSAAHLRDLRSAVDAAIKYAEEASK